MILIKGKLKAVSPFMVGSGSDNNSDSDVIRDADSKPYIPGTTLAGVIRAHLSRREDTKDYVNQVFGYHENKNDIESRIVFYDAKLEGDVKLEVRDSVRLYNKVAVDKSKFDYEVVGEGATFSFRFKLNDEELHLNEGIVKTLIYAITTAFDSGEVRIGSKTTRGFGEFKLDELKCLKLILNNNKTDMYTYINLKPEWSEVVKGIDEYFNGYEPTKDNSLYETINKKIYLKNTLFIRDYSTTELVDKDDENSKFVDAASFTNVNNAYVIPGTAWAGVFRRHASRILKKAGKSEEYITAFIDELFGYETKLKDGELNPSKEDKEKKSVSKIIFFESVIPEGSVKAINRTRSAVDRFTGSALDKALFTDRILCADYDSQKAIEEQAIELKIMINKEFSEFKLAKSLIEACIADLLSGMLSIGGNTAIGAGIFYGMGEGESNE